MKKYIVLIICCVSLSIPFNSGFGQSQDEPIEKQFEKIEFGNLILNVRTEAGRYLPGHVPVISGSVQDINGTSITAKIDLIVMDQDSNTIHQASISAEKGKFRYA
jgi:hypothetical protein